MIKKWVSIFCLIFLMVTTVVWAKPDSAYIDNGNGTVTDIETKLMWQQATAGKWNWYSAMSYCEHLSLAGYTGWELPTLDELRTLVDRSSGYNPTINRTYFPDTFSWFYWSSTTPDWSSTTPAPSDAWGMSFNGGTGGMGSKDVSCYVRAVRGGQSGLLKNLVISPLSQTVTTNAGSTTFGISNSGTGTGTIPWRAAVTAGSDWLSISSGAGGTDTGTITCAYTANTSTSSRTGTIRVTAYGGGTSTKDVTVILTQADACTATIDDKLLLHIPYLSSGKLLRWADLVNVFDDKNPTLILFKLTNYGVIENPSFSCKASTLSDDLKIIHIPDVLLPDGVTHLRVDMEYSSAFSTAEDDYFEAKNYEKISN
jgi:hypothetical protein